MRITLGMIRSDYTNNLYASLGALDTTRYQVETGRRFESSYEDPASAARGAILENRYARNSDYIEATQSATKWQDTQESVLMQLNSIATEVDKNYSVQAASDTNAENRSIYATQLREMQKSMVNILNTQYGDAFVMAGNDALEPPFTLSESGSLSYRGINVNENPPVDPADPDGPKILDELASETAYVDLGFGLTFKDGEVVSSSAFNTALPGIQAVGYGMDSEDDTIPNNLISLMGEMAGILDSSNFNRERYEILWTKFNESAGMLRDEMTEIGTKAQLLESTITKLEAEELNIFEQFEESINIDEAEAITNFSYANYVYNASLKIGNSILTPSLLDFVQM